MPRVSMVQNVLSVTIVVVTEDATERQREATGNAFVKIDFQVQAVNRVFQDTLDQIAAQSAAFQKLA